MVNTCEKLIWKILNKKRKEKKRKIKIETKHQLLE